MKVISFALWGDAPKYLVGAVRNAELALRWYAGWRCRFYCGASMPAVWADRLAAFPHVEVVRRPEAGDWTSMLWRLHAAADPAIDVALFRDADSRLGEREAAAVNAWLASRCPVHVMRDHPSHGVPILGGMWGVRDGHLLDMIKLIESYPTECYFQLDQQLLADVVAPRVRNRWLEHDEYFTCQPFPTRRRGREFVGQPFDEHDRPLITGPTASERRVRQAARRLLDRLPRSLRNALAP